MTKATKAKATYKSAGVDLDVYEQSMARLPSLMQRTFSPRVLPQAKGFAGMFQLDFASRLFARNYEEPVLVSATDGVGTKLKVAQLTGRHESVGIDLVAMSINDAICCGAEPLFFLDYVAMAKDDPELLERIVSGISQGCLQSDCALIGGETAIMPDLYQPGDYDLAGFCVGVVEKKEAILGKAIAADDIVLGVSSAGLHSNGYSLARKIVFEMADLGVEEQVAELGTSVGEALMTPTHIYARAVREVLQHYKVKNVVHGIAHITGGGLLENLARILPANVSAKISAGSWDCPAIFGWLQSLGNVDEDEMHRVFNMGLGLAVVVSPYYANHVAQIFASHGYSCGPIGKIEAGTGTANWA
jgi:phosphoribosylformylglycinamidine cyclo-ligase